MSVEEMEHGVRIKEESTEEFEDTDEMIDPSVNVKVEIEEVEGIKLEPDAGLDPLENVQVQYTEESSLSEPGSSSRTNPDMEEPSSSFSKLPENSGDSDIDVFVQDHDNYVQVNHLLKQKTKNGERDLVASKFICSICNLVTKFRYSMIAHLKRHRDKYKCDYCNYEASSKSDLKRHITANHNESYQCDECNYKTESKTLISRHKLQVHGKFASNCCEHCPFKTSCKKYLFSHMRSQHPKVRRYKCESCDQAFDMKLQLVKHRHLKHDRAANFCDQCDFSCIHERDLINHVFQKHKNLILNDLNSGMLI